jgi:hypothetical protein
VVCVWEQTAPPEDEGLNPEQGLLLRSRKRKGNSSEEGKWRDIFRILFEDVDDDEIPSPCRLIRVLLSRASDQLLTSVTRPQYQSSYLWPRG